MSCKVQYFLFLLHIQNVNLSGLISRGKPFFTGPCYKIVEIHKNYLLTMNSTSLKSLEVITENGNFRDNIQRDFGVSS